MYLKAIEKAVKTRKHCKKNKKVLVKTSENWAWTKDDLRPSEYSQQFKSELLGGLPIYACLRPLILMGQILQICTFTISKNSSGAIGCVTLSSWPILRFLGLLAKGLISMYTVTLILVEKDRGSKIKLMDTLWRCNFFVFGIYTLTVRWSLEFKWDEWNVLFRKAQMVHTSFHKIGIRLHIQKVILWAKLGAVLLPITAALHVDFVRRAYRGGLERRLLLSPFYLREDSPLLEVFQPVTLLFDYLTWAAQYFGDCLRFYFGFYIWMLYGSLHRGLKKHGGDKHASDIHDTESVINLHMKLTSLLNTMNKLLGPITFVGSLHTVLYCCYYVNYIMAGNGLLARKLIFVFYLVRNFMISLICADVNAKAHSFAEWIEDLCTTNHLDLVPTGKLLIFSTQMYSKDTIGFKGMQFFTITSSFLAAVVSIITTYTVVITQFSVEAATTETLTRLCGGNRTTTSR